MKAIAVKEPGNIQDFVEVEKDKPNVGADELLIEVYAVGINPVDTAIRKGSMPVNQDYPLILGHDISGVVAEVGHNVTEFSKGDEVFATIPLKNQGSLAEFVSVSKNNIVKKPEKVTFEEAATLGIAALTGYQLVHQKNFEVQEGETVFVQGGSGGVGTFAVQFAKQIGAHVIATTSRNEALLESLGVDEVVNYKKIDVAKKYANTVDLLIDTAGQGTNTLPVVKDGGHALTTTRPYDEEAAAKRNISVGNIFYKIDTKEMEQLADQVANKELTVVIDDVFPFTQKGVQDAYELSESGHAAGKIVVKVK